MKPKVLLSRVGLWSAMSVTSAALMITLAPLTARAVSIPTEVTEEGKKTYSKYCAPCHGDEGKGDGPLARSLLQNHVILPGAHTNLELRQADRSLRIWIFIRQSLMGCRIQR